MSPQLPLAIALLSTCPIYAQRATVKVEAAQVYSHQRTSKKEIVTALKRGDVVFVEFTISAAEGEWCLVHESVGVKFSGYVHCVDLEREATPVPYTNQISDSPATDTSGGTPGAKGSAVSEESREAQPRPAPPRDEKLVWHLVKYKADGGGLATLTYRNASGGTDQITVELPWSMTFYSTGGKSLYLSGQKKPFQRVRVCAENGILRPFECDHWERLWAQSFGPISISIYLDDVQLQTAGSTAVYGVASVSGTIP